MDAAAQILERLDATTASIADAARAQLERRVDGLARRVRPLQDED